MINSLAAVVFLITTAVETQWLTVDECLIDQDCSVTRERLLQAVAHIAVILLYAVHCPEFSVCRICGMLRYVRYDTTGLSTRKTDIMPRGIKVTESLEFIILVFN